MRRWTPGELIDLEHIADQCDRRAEIVVQKLNNQNDRTPYDVLRRTPYDVLRRQLRQEQQTSEALRDFCEIERKRDS